MAITGRPRKPTAILEITGAFQNHSNRRRLNEPTNIPDIGPVPDRLSPEQAEAWIYLVHRCPFGVLGKSDEVLVEVGACLLAEMWAGTLDCQTEKGGMNRAGTKMLVDILSKLGMTPVDRSKVSVLKRDGLADPAESYFGTTRPN